MNSLRDAIKSLDPIDQAMERFERGGQRCAKEIGDLHDTLLDVLDEAAQDAEELDEREAMLDQREEELDAREVQLDAREARLEARALPKLVAATDATP